MKSKTHNDLSREEMFLREEKDYGYDEVFYCDQYHNYVPKESAEFAIIWSYDKAGKELGESWCVFPDKNIKK
jgi:hypothetical protein